VFKDAFGIERDDDFITYCGVESGSVEPQRLDKANLRLDMRQGPDDDWNAAVLHVLVKRVEKAHHLAHLPPRPREYFQDIVRKKFERARAQWRKGQPRLTENDAMETLDELSSRIGKGKDRELTVSRDRERKASVCPQPRHVAVTCSTLSRNLIVE
jgi:hypothetical protein